jgi:hypothetical protein
MKVNIKGTRTEIVGIDVEMGDAARGVINGILRPYGMRYGCYEKNGQIVFDADPRCHEVVIANPTDEQRDVLNFCDELERRAARATRRAECAVTP